MKKLFYILCACICALSALIMCYGGYLNYVGEKNVFQQIANREILLEGIHPKYGKAQAVRKLGNFYLEPIKHMDVVARQSGTITKILVGKYENVKKGQVLAIMESKELEAQVAEVEASLAKARTAMDRAKISYSRYGQLIKQNVVSGERYDDAKSGYEGAVSEVKALEAQRDAMLVRRDQLTIKAPEDGYVDTFYYQTNSYVSASTPVMLLLDTTRMIFVEEIMEGEWRKLFPLPDKWTLFLDETDCRYEFSNDVSKTKDAYAKGFETVIKNILPDVEEQTNVRTITWSVENGGDLLYNMHYKNARLVSHGSHEGLIIPAIAMNGTKNEVYVWGKHNRPELRYVKTGYEMDKLIEIVEGLNKNDLVIITDPALFKMEGKFKFTVKEIDDDWAK